MLKDDSILILVIPFNLISYFLSEKEGLYPIDGLQCINHLTENHWKQVERQAERVEQR